MASSVEESVSTVQWVTTTPQRVRRRANTAVRRTVGLNQSPPSACNDPTEAYFPVDGVARLVHGDLASMLIGGIGSLLFQMLHPHSMAGVAQHSRYREDPRGRLLQTANFIGRTTYGSRATAHAAIERVLAVHQGVRGIADDGKPYYANDPHLLAWVHACEVSMFLRAYQNFGARKITLSDANAYVKEMATLAHDLGVEAPPTSQRELDARLESFRPELRLSADAVAARGFVMHGYLESPRQRLAYRFLVESSLTLMPEWSLDLLGASVHPTKNRLLVRPVSTTLCSILRVAVPPRPIVRT
jgi:uncharacterized protein (DUF2236 family)